MLTPADQQRLLALARQSLEARVRGTAAPSAPRDGALGESHGAFVTIRHKGDLRGCLGRLDRAGSLGAVVAHLAAEVSDSDPRFPPVQAHELADISIEISVLTPERAIGSIEEIEVGRHGLIAERGSRRGLLLPQVATEHGWDRQTLVEQTCVKAGLPPDAWRAGVRILSFEAQVFGETDG